MGYSEWHNDDLPLPKEPLNPARLFAAFLFAAATVGFIVFVGWLVLYAPVKVEIHEREGQIYQCMFYRNGDIKCSNMLDSDVGGGKVTP